MSGPIIGNYRIDGRLGSGTFATVWLAWDPDLERQVAIKVLADNWSADEDIRRRFLQEARILWRLDNPRIVRVFVTGTLDDGRPYFVMEYADAGTLLDRIRTHKEQQQPYSIIEAVTLSQEIADGLIVAHSRDIVHRDLKPSNILFAKVPVIGTGVGEAEDRLMLADFGIARLLEQASRMTVSAGTPFYMAPEQANPTLGRGPNQPADVYSAATILYELLTGTVPYPFDSISQIVRAQELGDRPSVRSLRPDVPEGLAHVIDTGLEPNFEQRYASAREWKDALAPFANPAPAVPIETEIRQAPAVQEPVPLIVEPPEIDGTTAEPILEPVPLNRKTSSVRRYGIGAGLILILAFGIWKLFLQPSPAPVPTPTPTPDQASVVSSAASTAQVSAPAPAATTSQASAQVASQAALQRLANNFSLIQTGDCFSEPIVSGTDAIVQCATSEATVVYREYTSASVMQLDVNFVNTNFNAATTPWHFGTDPNAAADGQLMQYLDQNGNANLFWTVTSLNMSGEAVAADGDQSALHNWWVTIGGVHPT